MCCNVHAAPLPPLNVTGIHCGCGLGTAHTNLNSHSSKSLKQSEETVQCLYDQLLLAFIAALPFCLVPLANK